jgi:DNA-binding FrmR family transcriptional regulator
LTIPPGGINIPGRGIYRMTKDLEVAACGCATGEPGEAGRKALGVDQEIKASNLKRLRRIEGQIRGIQKMVDEDRYCADIMIQVSAAQEALRTVGRALMRNHLTHCATQAFSKGTPEEAGAMYDELLDLIYKHSR